MRIAGDYEEFLATHRRADERSVPWYMTFGRDNPDSIIACINRARENAPSACATGCPPRCGRASTTPGSS